MTFWSQWCSTRLFCLLSCQQSFFFWRAASSLFNLASSAWYNCMPLSMSFWSQWSPFWLAFLLFLTWSMNFQRAASSLFNLASSAWSNCTPLTMSFWSWWRLSQLFWLLSRLWSFIASQLNIKRKSVYYFHPPPVQKQQWRQARLVMWEGILTNGLSSQIGPLFSISKIQIF